MMSRDGGPEKYGGLTTNERLSAAGVLDAFDDAVRHRDRALMVTLLMKAQIVQHDAESIADTILADRTLYGRAIPWSFEQAKAYAARVRAHLHAMLDTERRFPCTLGVAHELWDWDRPLIFYLEPMTPYDGTFEGKSIIDELNCRLNESFKRDECYTGIEIQVPHRFLGQAFLTEQDRENQAHRYIRLQDKGKR
jgi:hypothetical protein